MLSKKHRIILTAVSVIVLLGILVTASAVAGGKKPSVESGGYESLIADRIAIRLENTEFVLKKTSGDAERFTFSFVLTLKKTQADFYAVIDSFRLSGISYDNIVFTALNEETEGKDLASLELPAYDGEAAEMKWQIDVTASFMGEGTYDSVIEIMHTTGVTEETARQKLTEIPVKIIVE